MVIKDIKNCISCVKYRKQKTVFVLVGLKVFLLYMYEITIKS